MMRPVVFLPNKENHWEGVPIDESPDVLILPFWEVSHHITEENGDRDSKQRSHFYFKESKSFK